MKAIRVSEFGGPETLTLQTIPDPVAAAGQVLIRVKAAGVNPVETYIRSGHYAQLPELPYTPGRDAAGTVAMVGSGVKSIAPGDRVYTAGSVTGTYAELALADATSVHSLPDRASFQQGAALGIPYATAYRALFQRACAKAGEIVLVHGATGAVGLAATQLAFAAGLHVIGTGGSDAGRRLVAAQGAECVLDHHADHYSAELMDWTNGRGVDVILEMLANENLGGDLSMLARGGRIIIIGSRGRVEIDPREAMSRDANILGMLLWNTPHEDDVSLRAALWAGLTTGALDPVISEEVSLADASSAHRKILQSGAVGKIVLIP